MGANIVPANLCPGGYTRNSAPSRTALLYLGLELMSLAIYALVAIRRDDVKATEAAMKYFVLGSLASGFLLYGMSMIYGATGLVGSDDNRL